MVRESGFDADLEAGDRIFFLSLLLGVKQEEFYNKIDPDSISEILTRMSNVWDGKSHAYQVLNYVLIGGRKYYLPACKVVHGDLCVMSDSPFFEFMIAEEYYMNLQNGNAFQKNLDGLVATLCRPYKRFTKGRKVFDSEFAENTIQKLTLSHSYIDEKGILKRMKSTWRGVSEVEKYAVLYWYRHAREALIKMYPSVFSNSSKGKKADYTSKYRWSAVHEELAGKAFGDHKNTGLTNVHNILHHVNYHSDKFKEMEVNHIVNG